MSYRAMVLRNMKSTVRRFAMTLALLAGGAATLLTVSGVVGGAVAQTAAALDTTSSLTILELSSVSTRGPATPITHASLSDVAGRPGVEWVRPYAQLGISVVDVAGAGDDVEAAVSGAFWATPRIGALQPGVAQPVADDGADLAADEVLMPDSYLGTDLRSLVGATLTVQYIVTVGPGEGAPAEMELSVAGVYDNANPGRDGESAVYVSEPVFDALLAASAGTAGQGVPGNYVYPTAYVKTTSTSEAARVQGDLVTQGFSADNLSTNARELPVLLEWLSRVDRYLASALLLFCVGAGFSMGGTWSILRRWDVGLLVALGWSRAQILRAYALEVGLIGLAVGAAGALLGAGTSVAVSVLLRESDFLGAAGGLPLPPLGWVLAVLVGVPVALLLGSLLRVVRLTGVDPDSALRRPD